MKASPSLPGQPSEEQLRRIVEARHHDPFSLLGRHLQGNQVVVRAFLPFAERVWIEDETRAMQRVPITLLLPAV